MMLPQSLDISCGSFRISLRFVACLLFAVIQGSALTSCTSAPSAASPQTASLEEQYIYHRIKYSGETVAVISAWYTKSAKNWPEIVEANPKMVPSRLHLGDLVRIPKSMVKRFSSLPPDFVTSFKSGVNKDTSKSGTSTEAVEESATSTVMSKEASQTGDSYTFKEKETVAEDISADAKKQAETVKMEEVFADSTVVEESAPAAIDSPSTTKAGEMPANDENQKIRDQLMQELLQ